MFDLCDVTQSDVSVESLKHSRNTSLKKIKFTVKNVTFDFHFQTSEVKKIKINRHLKRGKKELEMASLCVFSSRLFNVELHCISTLQ